MARSSADRSKPMEGRCNASTKSGYCHGHVKAGSTRCRIHGGHRQQWANRQRALGAAAQAELEGALSDPDLLDVRRPIALAEVVIGRTPLLPSEEQVTKLAQRRILQRMNPGQLKALMATGRDDLMELLEPTEADRDEVRLDLHERSMRLISIYAQRQADAVKQLEWSRVIRESALPLLAEFGLRLSRILRKYLPEDQIPRVMDDVRKEIVQVVGEMSVLKDSKK